MKTLTTTVVLALALSNVSMATTGRVTSKAHRPAKVATYQMAAYPSVNATHLYVSVDKGSGGFVNIQLKDARGVVFFTQTLAKKEAKVRLKLNVTELNDGAYQLEVSNGVDKTVRDVSIATNSPSQIMRNIVLL